MGMGHLSRRQFLERSAMLAAATAGAKLWVPNWRSREAWAQTNGLIAHPDLATYARTIVPTRLPSDPEDPYVTLDYEDGWPLVVRTIDTEPRRGREDRRVALLSLLQLTDVQVPDGQSPARVEFLGHLREPGDTSRRDAAYTFRPAWRPHETATMRVSEASVRAVRSVGRGPATGRRFDFAISTGDNIDNMQDNELDWFLALMNGGTVEANSGDEDEYEGVQQYPQDEQEWHTYDRRYWHPDEPPEGHPAGFAPDEYKVDFGYPDMPGFLNAALAPFEAVGVGVPWYSAYGNHDGLVQGNAFPNEAFETFAIGPVKIMAPDGDPQDLLDAIAAGDPDAIENLLTPSAPHGVGGFRLVSEDERRRFVMPYEYVERHLESGGQPTGHGFTEENLGEGSATPGSSPLLPASMYSERDDNTTLYYTFHPAPGIRGICLDTTNRLALSEGSIGRNQFQWLEQRLLEVHSRWYDGDGNEQRNGNDDQLVVLFAHHNLPTMDNSNPSPDDPERVPADEVEDLLHRFPNVIAFINGHSHINRVWARPDPQGRTEGFWEISTSAQLDYPMQTRAIELVDNRDGTLSIFCSLIDNIGPADPGEWSNPDSDIAAIAGHARELSFNDYRDFEAGRDGGWDPHSYREGTPEDQNVELLLAAPFVFFEEPDPVPEETPAPAPPEREPLPATGAGVGVAAGAAALAGVMALRERGARRERIEVE